MPDSANRMCDAIRALRKDCSLTQVDFASALGVAPASVYRWEAGTSNPDFELVIGLWALSAKHRSATATFFEEFLGDRIDAIKPLFAAAKAPVVVALDSSIADLPPDQHQLVLAFIEMLKNNKDETASQMMHLLLQPWKQTPRGEKPSIKSKEGSERFSGRRSGRPLLK
jgi:DNA-binding XRE family transcriptional regulator